MPIGQKNDTDLGRDGGFPCSAFIVGAVLVVVGLCLGGAALM